MRRTSAGEIKPPHFGHTTSSGARTFSRLIFRELGICYFLEREHALLCVFHLGAGYVVKTGFVVLALVHDELKLKRFTRFRLTREGGHRNRESAFAKRADSDCGNLTKPFDHPESSISHEQQFPTNVELN
jgi:hypothetical protein